MSALGILLLLVLIGIGCYAIYNDLIITKRIMKLDEKDVSLKKDLEAIIDKKTKLYYTKEDLETLRKPFDFSINKFI